MKSMELSRKEIGRLGENLAKKYLEGKGFYVTKGFGSSPDLKVYRTEPSDSRSRVSNYTTCEVKASQEQKFVHLPRDRQKKANDLFAQVKLLEVSYGRVKFEIRFRFLSSEADFLESELPTEWVEKTYRE